MKYYVTDCITGYIEEESAFDNLEEAKKVRAEWDAKRIADGGEPNFWIVVDENGEKVE